jgi:hypothetical protein
LALSDLNVELQTPCGKKLIPLETDATEAAEQAARTGDSSFHTMVTPESAVPASLRVWMDTAGHKVRIGEKTFEGESALLFEPECKVSSPVMVDAEQVGTFEAKSAAGKGLFVTGRKDTCYSYEDVAYGEAVAGRPRILRGAQVHMLDESKVHYFLKKAPSSVPAGAFGEAYLRELVQVPCPQ